VSNQAAGVFACRSPSQISAASYLNLIQDGSALRAAVASGAFGGAKFEDVRRAVADAAFARQSKLVAAIFAPSVSVSLLAADPFTVCFEGAHLTAWYLAVTVGGAVGIGFPAAALWASRGALAAGDSKAHFRAALFAALHRFAYATMVAHRAWVASLLTTIVTIITVAGAFASRDAGLARLTALGLVISLAACAGSMLVFIVQPYKDSHKWMNSGTTLLMLVPAAASATTVAIAYEQGATGGSPTLAPPIVAFSAFLLTFIVWLRFASQDCVRQRLRDAAEAASALEKARVEDAEFSRVKELCTTFYSASDNIRVSFRVDLLPRYDDELRDFACTRCFSDVTLSAPSGPQRVMTITRRKATAFLLPRAQRRARGGTSVINPLSHFRGERDSSF
jgi:hypothetical protein